MKAKEALHNIALYLGFGDVNNVSEDYKAFLNFSPEKGYEKTKKYFDKVEQEKPNSDMSFWSRQARLLIAGLIHAVYYQMVEKGEDSDILPFNLPKPNRSCSSFDEQMYISAWTAAVMTGETQISANLEEMVILYNRTHEMGFDNAVARRDKKPLPYNQSDVGEGFIALLEKEGELRDLISKSYKNLEAKTTKK